MTRTETPPPPSAEPRSVKLDLAPKLLIENWRAEMDAIALYRALARREKDHERAGVLMDMAKTEERHAEVMASRLREMGVALPTYSVGLRTRMIIALSRVFGTH